MPVRTRPPPSVFVGGRRDPFAILQPFSACVRASVRCARCANAAVRIVPPPLARPLRAMRERRGGSPANRRSPNALLPPFLSPETLLFAPLTREILELFQKACILLGYRCKARPRSTVEQGTRKRNLVHPRARTNKDAHAFLAGSLEFRASVPTRRRGSNISQEAFPTCIPCFFLLSSASSSEP